MVLLTMTPAIVEALGKIQSRPVESTLAKIVNTPEVEDSVRPEPSLDIPTVGKPISHSQIIKLSRELKNESVSPCYLVDLLRGSKVYVLPSPGKPKPTSEYTALMARLRREEESRAYERMINPPPPIETFTQRFPSSSGPFAFSSTNGFSKSTDGEDDEITYSDISRQMTLILNVLVSIVACAAALWMVARYWSTPARLGLSMSGSILVGVAEVVVYTGYLRRLEEAKGKAKKLGEVKEIIKTWVIGGKDEDKTQICQSESPTILLKEDSSGFGARRRKKDTA